MSCEMLFQDTLFVAPMIVLWTVIALLLLIVYIPRAEEIRQLKKRIARQAALINSISKGQAQAELEHVADLEQLRGDHALNVKSIEAEAQDAEIRAKNAEARTQQSEDLRRQIAEAADKLTKEAQG